MARTRISQSFRSHNDPPLIVAGVETLKYWAQWNINSLIVKYVQIWNSILPQNKLVARYWFMDCVVPNTNNFYHARGSIRKKYWLVFIVQSLMARTLSQSFRSHNDPPLIVAGVETLKYWAQWNINSLIVKYVQIWNSILPQNKLVARYWFMDCVVPNTNARGSIRKKYWLDPKKSL